MAHARAEYKKYLEDYPNGPHAKEVRQRLEALISGRRDRGSIEKSLWEKDFFGSLSLFYDLDKSFSDDGEESVNVSSLTQSLDATWRAHNTNYRSEAVFIGNYEYDMRENQDNEARSSSAYLELEDLRHLIMARVGRQPGNKGGVLGRFDGAHFGYRFLDKVALNLEAGFPVERTSDGLETDKYFYGINFDLGRFDKHWDFNVFLVNQIAGGLTDRRAVGGEIRYVSERGSFFTLLDYDILFNDLNAVLLGANWLLPDNKTRVSLSTDFRNSPFISTSNALIGQPYSSLEDLVEAVGEKRARELARDRTLDSRFVTLGLSRPISEKFQIGGDISWSKLGDAPASGGVESIESTGNEFYYSLQLIGTNLIKEGDISILDLRYADTKPRHSYTINFNMRYPVNHVWRVNPKMRLDYRSNKELPGSQWRARPSLRLDYRWHRWWHLETEWGFSYANRELPGLAEDKRGYFLTLGIRRDF